MTPLQKQSAVCDDLLDIDPSEAIHVLAAVIGEDCLIEMVISELHDLDDKWTIKTINKLYDELACGDETQEQINADEGNWLDRQRLQHWR